MPLEKPEKNTGTRHKARESALQMLFAADVVNIPCDELTANYWNELGDQNMDDRTRSFSNELVCGALREIESIDARIRTRAEHWRIERMAIVDRNLLRLAVYELLYQDTPGTVIINEALELARKFSTFEATQFVNGILDGIKQDVEKSDADSSSEPPQKASRTSSSK
jgi:transcription antitermination protein NusB